MILEMDKFVREWLFRESGWSELSKILSGINSGEADVQSLNF